MANADYVIRSCCQELSGWSDFSEEHVTRIIGKCRDGKQACTGRSVFAESEEAKDVGSNERTTAGEDGVQELSEAMTEGGEEKREAGVRGDDGGRR
eukprot:332688-Hanusia_phi.AAC.2